ncbi:MAG: hypothetical protein KIT14_19240 [bacterium]|nr:hypothetical protein [bacterium]
MLLLVGWPDAAPDASPHAGGVPDATAFEGTLPNGAAVSLASGRIATSPSGQVRVLFAGTLYNRAELAGGLGPSDAPGRRGAAEIALAFYLERGTQAVTALRGAFALAVVDQRRGRVVVVRDQLGLRPLYVVADGGRFAASDSLTTLLALPGVSSAWDLAALDAILTLGAVPAPATPYLAVRQVRPGELLQWDAGRLRHHRYWHLTFPERRLLRVDAPTLVRERLREALRLRQAGIVTGLLLSDGLVSTALLGEVAAERRPPAHAYVVATGRGGAEVARRATRFAARHGVASVVGEADPDWPALAERLLDVHGLPAVGLDLALLAPLLEGGIRERVLLSGHGGAEILGGADDAGEWAAVDAFRRLPGLARETAELWARLASRGRIASLVRAAPLAPVAFLARRSGLLTPADRLALWTPDAMALLGETAAEERLAGLCADAMTAGAGDPLDAIHHVALHLRLPALTQLHELAASYGVDLRFPLADHRLAKVAASVPADRRGGGRKRVQLLRGALADVLPASVLRRAHEPLVPTPAAWRREPLAALVDDALSPARLEAQGLFRPETIARFRAEHDGGSRDRGGLLWTLVLVSRWLERCRAQEPAARRAAG